MKKALFIFFLIITFVFTLTSCDNDEPTEPTISVSNDGYVVVNGIKTEYLVDKTDEISVSAGYLVVNGVKTEYEVNKPDEISISDDGYVIVNGAKTEYLIDKDDVITIEDGYLVVNGIKSEYEINKPDVVSVTNDGYVVVNGTKTEFLVDKEDVIIIVDGYLVVNGIKTEYEINKPDEITVSEDGYVTVNGTKTEYLIDKDDVITIEDGYIVVNGIKTEYEVKNKNHSFGEWRLYNEDTTHCEKKLYYRVCLDCSTIEWKDGKYDDHHWNIVTTKPTCQNVGYDTKTCSLCGTVEICNETNIVEHNYSDEYANDNSYHWKKCKWCESITDKKEHTVEDSGSCSICNALVGATEGIIYDVSSDGTYAEVIGYTGTATRIRIAEEYNGLPVKSIYDEAFYGNSAIISVTIPDSVTSIGISSFEYCGHLESIVIPNSVLYIKSNAFDHCGLKNIVIPDSVISIGSEAFNSCYSLESVIIGNNVSTIGVRTFAFCSSLESITLGDSVKTIAVEAFYHCSKLSTVVLPNSVTEILRSAFYGCDSLDFNDYGNCNYLGSKNNPYFALIKNTNSNLSSYTIHDDTAIIASEAFRGCSRLVSIYIPDGIVEIPVATFEDCSSLTDIVIPASVKIVDIQAFYDCEKLTDVYYKGTEYQWKNIEWGALNEDIRLANVHYGYIDEE